VKKLRLSLKNCYGIKKLDHEFDFSQTDKVYVIYAPNGSMKSSLAQTFKDAAEGRASKDRIFPTRTSTRIIVDEKGHELPGEAILVVPPYDEVFAHTEKTSTLLVNDKLRKEYEQLHIEIDKAKEQFLKALKQQSGGSKKNLEKEISSTFTKSDSEFYRALIRIKEELLAQTEAPFSSVDYDTIFDDKVLLFLGTKDFKTAIQEYIQTYNELIAASTFFRKGIFEYNNATTIAKSLADNGFFDAEHTINLNADEKVEIRTQKQLEALIEKEKESIIKDKALRKKFDEIQKLITKNVNVKAFQRYLTEHETLLPHLANVEQFKEEIWKSYIKVQIDLYNDLIKRYQAAEARQRQIEEEAKNERTQWERVIEIFNERFFVPFKLTAENRTAVILGEEPILQLAFTFEDGSDRVAVEKTTLLQALSQGEKKALYVLNIIFEVEARRKAKQETLFVVDDVADSFDYKNKYAILQYLKDIAEEPFFRQIILTHNFDFFRTVNYRFVPYSHCLMAVRTKTGILLEKATGVRNVFANDWKPNFFQDRKKRIASIPFMRNIIEYTKGEEDPDYKKLTSLLHWRPDSDKILQRDLDQIYKNLFSDGASPTDDDTPVIDMIRAEAKGCLTNGAGANFEHKIVLSIAIRLDAEEFMTHKIVTVGTKLEFDKNQTQRLLTKFEEKFSGDSDILKTLQRVVLMTPENIHLNSFMYEPILDMSDEHLKKLYKEVLVLRDTEAKDRQKRSKQGV